MLLRSNSVIFYLIVSVGMCAVVPAANVTTKHFIFISDIQAQLPSQV
jgi:hypothetical protein